MFIPNIRCWIRPMMTANVYGESQLGSAIHELCSVVRLRKMVVHTTVRSDSSATRGHADENEANCVILLGPKTKAKQGDQLEAAGVKVRINDIQPRFGVMGQLEHYEVRGEFWE
jgi:hypothetical protein